MDLSINTDKPRQVLDITEMLEEHLKDSGLINIFVKHTTCAITTADLDPGTDLDLLDALAAMTPTKDWRHPHDPSHFPDHLWSSLIGTSLTLPYKGGKILLGTWQRIVLIELNGPRLRQINLSLF